MHTQTITLPEAAKFLRLKESTIRAWLRLGKLKGHKAGHVWRVDCEDAEILKEFGAGMKFRGHAPTDVRGALCDAFDYVEGEWWESFDRIEHAYFVLSNLWRCTDIVPSMLRMEIADWVDRQNSIVTWTEEKEKQVERIRRGCTYAQAVRLLKQELDDLKK